MHHLPLRLFLLVALSVLALARGVKCNDDVSEEYTFTGLRGEVISLIFPLGDSVYVLFPKLPANGALHVGKEKVELNEQYRVASLITYRSAPSFPPDGEEDAEEVFPIRLFSQENSIGKTQTLRIVVENKKLVTPGARLTMIDPNTTQILELPVQERRRGPQWIQDAPKLDVRAEVRWMTITNLPHPSVCMVKPYGSDVAITQVPTVIKDTEQKWRVVLQPLRLGVDENCTFSYSATHKNGVNSIPGQVVLCRIKPRLPVAYNRNISTLINARGEAPASDISVGGYSLNPSSKTINVTILSLPHYGKIFRISGNKNVAPLDDSSCLRREELPIVFQINTNPAIVYLNYKVDAVPLLPLFMASDRRVVDNFTFTVQDKYNTSEVGVQNITLLLSASPICADTVVSPVFYDRPLRNVMLNYTLPTGAEVASLVLLGTPKNPIGDLWFKRNSEDAVSAITRLVPGDYFSDTRRALKYAVRSGNEKLEQNETYTFQVRVAGRSCFGSITFVITPHNTEAENSSLPAIHRDVVRIDSYTMLSIKWTATKMNDIPPRAIEILKVSSFGDTYTVFSYATIDANIVVGSTLGVGGSFCFLHDCSRITNKIVIPGQVIHLSELWNGNHSASAGNTAQFFLIYKAPAKFPNSSFDVMEYNFVDEDGVRSSIQRLQLYFRKAYLQERSLTYTVECEGRASSPHYGRQMRKVTFPDVSEEEVIMIDKIELASRHSPTQTLFFYRCEREGDKMVSGELMQLEAHGGFMGYWLQKENTVFVWTAARNPTLFLRVRMFRRSLGGAVLYNMSRRYFATVRRSNQSPVSWLREQTTGGGNVVTTTKKQTVINVTVSDKYREGFAFRVHESPKWGRLQFLDCRFARPLPIVVHRGSVQYVPFTALDAEGTATLSFLYLSEGSADWVYPLQDNFTLLIDDGGVVFSEPIVVKIVADMDKQLWFSRSVPPGYVRTAAVSVFLLSIWCTLLFAALMLWRKTRRARYMFVPMTVTSQ
ncbi:hypothetical protein DQ04_02861050 [Trypanosoma grayi]|uniref:hypothetical protein n=1 Tax=Trypanosoma grayi TaxID=71804 RepID=UPI0004F4A1C9|nr:hypothetical protein DQ04_02861050 [Trypanosoma grayi]KEG11205.1 hypothetical protein DQ04_02861050 [Trypanosoma grayi]